MDFAAVLSKEFNIGQQYVNNIIELIGQGNTLPFIARYRKELTNTIDDQVLRQLADRLEYLTNLEKRKADVQATITEQGKWNDELAAALSGAETLTEVEDIYRPYKQKKKTRASVAIAKGLQPLADIILAQQDKTGDALTIAQAYVTEEVATAADAVKGACDIIAEMISDNADLRKWLRDFYIANATLDTKFTDTKSEKLPTYDMYKQYSEAVGKIPSHRILAINRGEADECLKVNFTADKEAMLTHAIGMFVKGESIFTKLIQDTAQDSLDRLILPSIEREMRTMLTDKADEQAIKMFQVNLKPLLMQPPLKGKVVMAVDPAYRTGCKIAVVDAQGNALDTTVVYVTPPQSKIEEGEVILTKLINKHKVDVISIGNGTASKEAEIFVAGLIKKQSRSVAYAVVNEAGASVYSASKLGAEEFPEYDVSLRSAVSIARRLQDPLAELIKIDVKSIGVGQYQHDMPQARLSQVLEGVVEECVNNVGVDVNTASVSLLKYIAGLNGSTAKNLIEFRRENHITDRMQLLRVPKLGAKAFEQCAGFLRVVDGVNVLDNTSVHPEAYSAVDKLLKHFNYSYDDVKDNKIGDLKHKIEVEGVDKVALLCEVGAPTLMDIVKELLKPGRDIRDELPMPVLRSDLMDIKDLKAGMEIEGVVRNVIDFGAFIDIGVHQDGLVHISQISDDYIKHPSEVLSVGERLTVKVLDVDVSKNKISLTLKTASCPGGKKGQARKQYNNTQTSLSSIKPKPLKSEEEQFEEKLAELMKKFGNK